MLDNMETVAMKEKLGRKMETAKLKMMRWALGVTLKERIKNRYIWGTAGVRRMGEKLRGERLRWYRHVRRRKTEYVGRKMLEMGVPGKRKRERPGEDGQTTSEMTWREQE